MVLVAFRLGLLAAPANKTLKLTGAAIPVSRGMKVLQAAPQLSFIVRRIGGYS